LAEHHVIKHCVPRREKEKKRTRLLSKKREKRGQRSVGKVENAADRKKRKKGTISPRCEKGKGEGGLN